MIKNVAQSKRQRYVRIVDSLQERWFGSLHLLIYWMVWEGGVVFFEIWIYRQNQFFNCGGVFHDRSFQLSARWDSPFPRNILKFCHIDSVEIGSNFVYDSYYILRIYFGGKEITTCLINNQTYCTSKNSILSIEKLHDSGNYLQQNAEVLTRVVGSWPNVRTFAVCLQQKSRDITRENESRKGKLPVLRTFCHNWMVQIILW